MKSKINLLILEKQQLLDKIKNQEKNYINHKRRYSWSNLQSPKFGHKRNISFTDFGYNKFLDNNICMTESNNIEFEDNNKYLNEKKICLKSKYQSIYKILNIQSDIIGFIFHIVLKYKMKNF